MAREKEPEVDTTGEIPKWFMTYSDVITLLMTFFILLLTFATNEPEKFERMQVSMFGGAGATGIAGEAADSRERDALVVRQRPHAGRISLRGSEMPPQTSDPTLETLGNGLKSLDEQPEHQTFDSYLFQAQLELFADGQNNVTPIGKQRLQMIATQMYAMPFDVRFDVNTPGDADKAFALAEYMVEQAGIKPGRVSISIHPSETPRPPGNLRIELRREPR